MAGITVRVPFAGFVDINLDHTPDNDDDAHEAALDAFFASADIELQDRDGVVGHWEWETYSHIVQGNVCYVTEAHVTVMREDD